ncbi:MAG TPA: SDR family oxidoreductase [Pyrinomonadaceae bacterium]|jgi:uncharacterized protein YbjT (DUF2867 family)
MLRVLLIGATGQLGRHALTELSRQGEYRVRALVRSRERLEEICRAQGLEVESIEVFVGDATRAETLGGVCEGIDVLISTLGAPLSVGRTKGRVSYTDVDLAGNRNLLAEALRSGVKKFVYVSVFGAHLYPQLEYVKAHEDFVRELRAASEIDHCIVRPTGFFYVFAEFLQMARRGRVALIGAGDKKTNPIDERDLAAICVEAIKTARREILVGGPEIYTRREIVELAFAALGKQPKLVRVPPRVVRLMLGLVKLFDRRLHALFSFLVAVSEVDAVAPARGTHTLMSYFQELANATKSAAR